MQKGSITSTLLLTNTIIKHLDFLQYQKIGKKTAKR